MQSFFSIVLPSSLHTMLGPAINHNYSEFNELSTCNPIPLILCPARSYQRGKTAHIKLSYEVQAFDSMNFAKFMLRGSHSQKSSNDPRFWYRRFKNGRSVDTALECSGYFVLLIDPCKCQLVKS
jgi:hypothetical protein